MLRWSKTVNRASSGRKQRVLYLLFKAILPLPFRTSTQDAFEEIVAEEAVSAAEDLAFTEPTWTYRCSGTDARTGSTSRFPYSYLPRYFRVQERTFRLKTQQRGFPISYSIAKREISVA